MVLDKPAIILHMLEELWNQYVLLINLCRHQSNVFITRNDAQAAPGRFFTAICFSHRPPRRARRPDGEVGVGVVRRRQPPANPAHAAVHGLEVGPRLAGRRATAQHLVSNWACALVRPGSSFFQGSQGNKPKAGKANPKIPQNCCFSEARILFYQGSKENAKPKANPRTRKTGEGEPSGPGQNEVKGQG